MKQEQQPQQSIMLYKIMHDQSTPSPEEDKQYVVETSQSTCTSYVTTSWDTRKNLAFKKLLYTVWVILITLQFAITQF